jgi:peroxiredoxin
MRDDLVVGNEFPDISLPEHTGKELSLEVIARRQPLVLAFVRGWWCPKEQIRLKKLVDAQDELQREYGRIAVVSVDEPYVNGAFRAGIGADFPFLSDEERRIADELDLLELTDELHRPFLPYTFVLDSNRIIATSGADSGTGGTRRSKNSGSLSARSLARSSRLTIRSVSGLRVAPPRRTPGSKARSSGSARTARGRSSGGEFTRVRCRRSATSSAARWWTAVPGSCGKSSARTAAWGSTSARKGRAAPIPTRWATTSPCRASRFRTCPGSDPGHVRYGHRGLTPVSLLAGEFLDRLRREAVECLDGELEVLQFRVLELRVRQAAEALDEEHDRGDARAGNLGRIV